MVIEGNIVEEIAKRKDQSAKDILIEGSATLVESLSQAGLIDDYSLMVHPVLKLVDSKPIHLGVILLTYEPIR